MPKFLEKLKDRYSIEDNLKESDVFGGDAKKSKEIPKLVSSYLRMKLCDLKHDRNTLIMYETVGSGNPANQFNVNPTA